MSDDEMVYMAEEAHALGRRHAIENAVLALHRLPWDAIPLPNDFKQQAIDALTAML